MAARKHLSAVPLLVALAFACLPASALAAGKTQEISFTSAAPANAKVEGPSYTVTATATSGLPVSFSSATPGKCGVSGSTVSFIGAGTCTIDANQAGNGEWEPAKQVTQSFAVAKGTQTVTFASTPPSKPVVGGAYVPTVHKGVSGEEVLLSVDATSTEVCAVTGTEKGGWSVSFTGAGTCTLDANQPGNANYEPAPLVQQSMLVKRTQTITAQHPNSEIVGTSYKAEAEATSHLPVTVTSATEKVCTVGSESMVTLVAAGTCELHFSQAGNGEYEPAQFSQSFQAVKGTAPQTIQYSSLPPEPTLVGFNYKVEAKGGASGNPVTFSIDLSSASICTISGSTVTFVAGGTCTIDANQAGNEIYAPAPTAQQQVVVTKNAQAIEFTSSSPAPALVGGTYSVSATATSGLAVSFSSATTSVCTVSGSTVKLVGGGTCTIDADQGGNGQWGPAAQKQQSFAVQVVATTGPTGPTVPIKTVLPPNSNFKVVAASLSLATYSITFVEAVSDPGTFNWVLTFENGKFGNYGATMKAKKCKAGWIKLKGSCRPARVRFGQGRETVSAAGNVTFTVHPTKAGVAALRKAFGLSKGLPVTAHVTYQSIHGGSPVARVQSLIVKGKR
jgi:large repetitive protein